MAAPLIPILLLGGGVALALAASHAHAAPPAKPGGTPKPAGSGKYDPGMDADTEAAVDRMLAFDDDPNELREMALSLRPEFPRAADMLDTKANARSFTPPALVLPSPGPAPQPGPPPSPPLPPPGPPPLPPSPPPFVPPPSPPSPVPPSPPIDPPPPPPADPGNMDLAFDPGPLPRLPPIPAAGAAFSPDHQSAQRAILHWAQSVLAEQGDKTGVLQQWTAADADGRVGQRTQTITQLFQSWYNQNRNGPALTLDGLFGPATYAALAEWR